MTIFKLTKKTVVNSCVGLTYICLYKGAFRCDVCIFGVTKEALSEHCKLCIFSFKCSNLCRKYATLRKND